MRAPGSIKHTSSTSTELIQPLHPSVRALPPLREAETGKRRLLSHDEDNPVSFPANPPPCPCTVCARQGGGHCQPRGSHPTPTLPQSSSAPPWVCSDSGKGELRAGNGPSSAMGAVPHPLGLCRALQEPWELRGHSRTLSPGWGVTLSPGRCHSIATSAELLSNLLRCKGQEQAQLCQEQQRCYYYYCY